MPVCDELVGGQTDSLDALGHLKVIEEPEGVFPEELVEPAALCTAGLWPIPGGFLQFVADWVGVDFGLAVGGGRHGEDGGVGRVCVLGRVVAAWTADRNHEPTRP